MPANYNTQMLFVQLGATAEAHTRLLDMVTMFAIYTAVVGPEQPHCIPELMVYQLEIAKCTNK